MSSYGRHHLCRLGGLAWAGRSVVGLLALMAGSSGCDRSEPLVPQSTGDAHHSEDPWGHTALHAPEGLTELDVSSGVPDYPVFVITPPLRAQDLKIGDVPRFSSSPGHRWHDLNVARWDEGWKGHEPGIEIEQHEIDWGLPVYAGVDGEVIDCWRNSPYEQAYAEVSDKQRVGGNFLTIRTADDYFVYYAHMDTDSIPPEVCPNESADGWLVDKSETIDCLIAPSCITAETYLEPGERPQIQAGQYIGRIGAHGQAAGAHLHVHVGHVVEDANGLLNTVDQPHHLVYDRAWFQPKSTPMDTGAWTEVDDEASRQAMLAAIDESLTMFWPDVKVQPASMASVRLGDYDGDGRDDLLCHSTQTGTLWRDRASEAGEFDGTDWSHPGGWCSTESQRLHIADVDGDGLTDLVCHDQDGGDLWVDLASSAGEFYGANFFTGASRCRADTQQLWFGDFDGDGADDLLCHDVVDGSRSVDLSQIGRGTSNRFEGVDHFSAGPWCHGHYERLHLGDFNGDGRVDLLCHDTLRGTLDIDYASAAGAFDRTDATLGAWCNDGGQRLMVAEVMASRADDLVCVGGGLVMVDVAPLGSTDWSGEGVDVDACDGPHQRLRMGDMDGDGRDDLLCFDPVSGERWIDYAASPLSPGGIFGGPDWSSGASGWCDDPRHGLH